MTRKVTSRALKPGAPVRFVFGLRKVSGRVVEAIVPPKPNQPVVYRVAFSESESQPMELVLRDTDLKPAPRPSSSRKR